MSSLRARLQRPVIVGEDCWSFAWARRGSVKINRRLQEFDRPAALRDAPNRASLADSAVATPRLQFAHGKLKLDQQIQNLSKEELGISALVLEFRGEVDRQLERDVAAGNDEP